MISSLHFNATYGKDTKIELYRGVTYRFTVRTGDDAPVQISSLPEHSSEEAPVSMSLFQVDIPA